MTSEIKPVDLSDEQIDLLEQVLMITLDPENSVQYFIESSNLREAEAKPLQLQFDSQNKIKCSCQHRSPEVERAEKKLQDIRLHYRKIRKNVRRVLTQAKIANELHKNICKGDQS